jgi:hypothetical protein
MRAVRLHARGGPDRLVYRPQTPRSACTRGSLGVFHQPACGWVGSPPGAYMTPSRVTNSVTISLAITFSRQSMRPSYDPSAEETHRSRSRNPRGASPHTPPRSTRGASTPTPRTRPPETRPRRARAPDRPTCRAGSPSSRRSTIQLLYWPSSGARAARGRRDARRRRGSVSDAGAPRRSALPHSRL